MERQQILAGLKKNPEVSVLIVGAGINGIGAFRDLALNGADVLLIEGGDFCSGASAASSHMAHGGIRYLENGEFRLVREAVNERNRLLRNAPHLVKPLPTTIPIFKRLSGIFNAPLKFLGLLDKPSERGSLIIKLGLMLYDAFTGKKRILPRHRFLSRAASLERWKSLNPKVVNTATYYDGLITNPERLALEILLDAEIDNPAARALNYVCLLKGGTNTVTLKDEISDEEFEISPKLLINASGPWIDFTNAALERPTRYIAGTKGSHIVVDNPELRAAIGDSEFFFENKDGRIVLILPLSDRVLLGTSDIRIDQPDEARCTDEEVDYILGFIEVVFPDIPVSREQIVFRFSGVRPLGNSGARTTGQYSRDHHIRVQNAETNGEGFPVYSLVGGKWTSFRAFAEKVADLSLAFLGIPRKKSTKELPIGGGAGYLENTEERKEFIDRLSRSSGMPADRLQVLYDRYGSRITAVTDFILHAEDKPLLALPDYSRREILFLVQFEKVIRLSDLLLRRTMLAMLGRLSRDAVNELAEITAEALGWSDSRKLDEISRALALLADRHGVAL